MKRFAVLDISGDAGIKAYGNTLEELFVNAAEGMYSLVIDPEGIEARKDVEVSVESASMEGLMVAWLNELIFRFDAYGFLGKKIRLVRFSPSGNEAESAFSLEAVISGEEFDPARHEGKLLIKAATYHMLSIRKQGKTWQAEVIFDI